MTEATPVAAITAVIASRVRYLRKEQLLSGPALAKRLVGLGLRWNRTTVAKFETGLRGSITVQELLALALALDVPPIWLLVDPTQDHGAPLGPDPDDNLNPWLALMWVMGRQSLSPGNGPGGREWGKAGTAIEFARQLWNGVRSLQLLDWERSAASEGSLGGDELDEASLHAREVRLLQAMLQPVEKFREQGYAPYPLPEWVLHRADALGIPLRQVGR